MTAEISEINEFVKPGIAYPLFGRLDILFRFTDQAQPAAAVFVEIHFLKDYQNHLS